MNKLQGIILGTVAGVAVSYGAEVLRTNRFKKVVTSVLERFHSEDRERVLPRLEEDIKSGAWKEFEFKPAAYVHTTLFKIEAEGVAKNA